MLGGITLPGKGRGALTDGLPMQVIGVRFNGGGMLLYGTGTGANRRYFGCGLVWSPSTNVPSDRMY